jgi:hypothetical protein
MLGPSPGTRWFRTRLHAGRGGAPDKEPPSPVKRILISAVAALALLVGVQACTTEDVSKLAIQTYFPEQYDKAVAVATCESGLDPSAVSSGGGNWGLFQINLVHAGLVGSMGYRWAQLTDPFVNAKVARVIYDQSGWGAWACG